MYQMEHRLDKNPSTPLTSTMANDFVSFTDSDTVSDYDNYMDLEFTGRRRGGPTPKRKGAKQAVPQNTFDFARTGGNLLSASGIDLAALFGDDLAPITDTVTTSTSQSTTDSTTDQTTLSSTSDSPVVIQVRISILHVLYIFRPNTRKSAAAMVSRTILASGAVAVVLPLIKTPSFAVL